MNPTNSRRMVISGAALLALAIIVLLGVKVLDFGPTRPNVVVIIMDTVRRDHLSCYGYERPTTPNLDALAAKSRVYTKAYSTSGWTTPAHGSLFTGLFPIAHGATQESPYLNRNLTTFAEIMAESGYHSIGISENPMLARNRGFSQGFDKYHETWKMPPAEENHAVALVRQDLAERNTDQPFFMFINFIEPHSPYDSSEQFFPRFISDDSLDLVANRWPEYHLGEVVFSPAEIEHLENLYDAEILYVDSLVGQVMDELKRLDLWDDTVFIVTSDHGENFGDHELMDHVFSLHESTTRIPLIVHYPREFEPGSREADPVQLTDILPTVQGLVGIDPALHPLQGIDLLGENAAGPRTVFCEYHYPHQALGIYTEEQLANKRLDQYKRRLASIILEDYKLIFGGDDRHELYNLTEDPDETRNLIGDPEMADIKLGMMDLLIDTLEEYARGATVSRDADQPQADEATKKALKSLGYVR